MPLHNVFTQSKSLDDVADFEKAPLRPFVVDFLDKPPVATLVSLDTDNKKYDT